MPALHLQLPRAASSIVLLVFAVGTATDPAGSKTSTPLANAEIAADMIEQRNAATVRAAFDQWKAGGDVFAELLAPDVVWTIHGSGPVAGTYSGRDELIDRASTPLVTRLATPIVPKVHRIVADGGTVIVRFSGAATTRSGEPYRNEFVWIFRMRNNRVVEGEAFLDLVAYQRVVETDAPRPR
ncbi:nuclear transport factor 2 family protein [Sphingomonas sp. FW199]|uniref:nuclear transport factor 2 family protein n=1 Tax=Sphingomonas sp. FW199 TaxID=3400217 RepID=UPI003CEDD575